MAGESKIIMICWFATILLLIVCDPIHSRGLSNLAGQSRLTITLYSYHNQDDKLIDGSLCDTKFQGVKESACDPTFSFEVVREGGSGKPLFSQKQQDHFENSPTVNFTKDIGGIANPIELDIDLTKKGQVFLKIRVEDHNADRSNNLIDIFVYQLDKTFTPKDDTASSHSHEHTLSLSYQYTCKLHYYGEDCAQRCIGNDDDTNGHYSCSSSGAKVCLAGWTNVDSDCKVPDWCIWC